MSNFADERQLKNAALKKWSNVYQMIEMKSNIFNNYNIKNDTKGEIKGISDVDLFTKKSRPSHITQPVMSVKRWSNLKRRPNFMGENRQFTLTAAFLHFPSPPKKSINLNKVVSFFLNSQCRTQQEI